jgi:rubrerythrin
LELRTFSAVLKFTLQLEDHTAQFYQSAASSEKYPQARQTFLTFSEDSKKRKKILEKTARESVDHSLLEPISGLLEEQHAGSPVFSESMSYGDVLVAAKQLEEIAQRLYTDAGERISFIPTVSRLYKRYAQERSKALATLQGLS